jgi:hypothetical protein
MVALRVDVLRGNGTVISGPVPGLVDIGAPVGQGGANRRDDVQAVQTALNIVGGAGFSRDLAQVPCRKPRLICEMWVYSSHFP